MELIVINCELKTIRKEAIVRKMNKTIKKLAVVLQAGKQL
jgi:hypothetical protein